MVRPLQSRSRSLSFFLKQILRIVASGNVYKAIWAKKGDRSRGVEVAVKLVRATLVDQATVRKFRQEVLFMAPLRHNNMIALIGACANEGPDKLCIVLEYASQGSLKEVCKEKETAGPWGPRRYHLALGTAQAIEYLHHEQPHEPIIHRDIKKDNVSGEVLRPPRSRCRSRPRAGLCSAGARHLRLCCKARGLW